MRTQHGVRCSMEMTAIPNWPMTQAFGHQMSGRACNREFGGTGSNRKRQEQLVGEVEFDGGCRCVMLAQRANRLVGNAFGRPPQPAIGGKLAFRGS